MEEFTFTATIVVSVTAASQDEANEKAAQAFTYAEDRLGEDDDFKVAGVWITEARSDDTEELL